MVVLCLWVASQIFDVITQFCCYIIYKNVEQAVLHEYKNINGSFNIQFMEYMNKNKNLGNLLNILKFDCRWNYVKNVLTIICGSVSVF